MNEPYFHLPQQSINSPATRGSQTDLSTSDQERARSAREVCIVLLALALALGLLSMDGNDRFKILKQGVK